MDRLRKNFTMAQSDAVMASDEKLKKLKKKMNNLYKELRLYTESYRKFIASQQSFYTALHSLYEDNWVEKEEFKRSFQVLANISQNGAKNLETIPVEETIVFKDQFGPYEKEIKDYVEKSRQRQAADRKVQSYQRKKSMDADELRRLQNVAYEKATSARIVQRKLQDELPKFYNSRLEFYSKLWRSVFQIQGDIAKAESETMSHLLSIVRDYDRLRGEGIYDCDRFVVSAAEPFENDDYSVEDEPEPTGTAAPVGAVGGGGGSGSDSRAGGSLRSRRSSNCSLSTDVYDSVVPRAQRSPPQKFPKPKLMAQDSSLRTEGDDKKNGRRLLIH